MTIDLESILRFLNLLLVPAVGYIIKLEKRMSKMEKILGDLCNANCLQKEDDFIRRKRDR